MRQFKQFLLNGLVWLIFPFHEKWNFSGRTAASRLGLREIKSKNYSSAIHNVFSTTDGEVRHM